MPISNSITSFRQEVKNACNGIGLPDNTLEAMGKSALFSFTISAILSGSLEVGVVIGGIAAVSSLVHALTTPIFRHVLGREKISWFWEIPRMVINLSLAQVLINSLTAYRVNLLGGCALTIGLSLLVNGFDDYSLRETSTYIFI